MDLIAETVLPDISWAEKYGIAWGFIFLVSWYVLGYLKIAVDSLFNKNDGLIHVHVKKGIKDAVGQLKRLGDIAEKQNRTIESHSEMLEEHITIQRKSASEQTAQSSCLLDLQHRQKRVVDCIPDIIDVKESMHNKMDIIAAEVGATIPHETNNSAIIGMKRIRNRMMESPEEIGLETPLPQNKKDM